MVNAHVIGHNCECLSSLVVQSCFTSVYDNSYIVIPQRIVL